MHLHCLRLNMISSIYGDYSLPPPLLNGGTQKPTCGVHMWVFVTNLVTRLLPSLCYAQLLGDPDHEL